MATHSSAAIRSLKRKASVQDFTDATMAKIQVGKGADAKFFPVHEKTITAISPVLKAGLEGDWTEGKSKVYSMDAENDAESVNLLVQWAYGGKTDLDALEKIDNLYDRLIKLWILADRLGATGLMNYVIQTMAKKTPVPTTGDDAHFDTPKADSLKTLWSNTVKDSPIRTSMVALLVHHFDMTKWSEGDLEKDLDGCLGLAFDMIRYLIKAGNKITEKDCPHCRKVQTLYSKD